MKIINLNSELHIDNEVDSAYLYLYLDKNIDNKVDYTSWFIDENNGWNINIDYSSDWKILWIEFIPASIFF